MFISTWLATRRFALVLPTMCVFGLNSSYIRWEATDRLRAAISIISLLYCFHLSAQYLFHRHALCQLIDQLVQIVDFAHGGLFDISDAGTADHACAQAIAGFRARAWSLVFWGWVSHCARAGHGGGRNCCGRGVPGCAQRLTAFS